MLGSDSEFKVALVGIHDGSRGWPLYPHLRVYGDGVERCGGD